MTRLSELGLLVCLCLWLSTSEAHFSLAPKITVAPLPLPEPETPLMHLGEIRISRGDFSDYLDRLTTFETKYQRLQPSFSSHFNLVRGVVFFHPDNVHQYIDTIASLDGDPRMGDLLARQWIKGQLGLYRRLRGLLHRAREGGLERAPDVMATLAFYSAGVKTSLLEELIVLGDMEPSVQGLRSFVADPSRNAERLMARGIESDGELTPPEEQRRLRDRWRRFRQDLLQATPAVDRCDAIESPSASPETPLVELGQRRITLADYLAVFGAPRDARRWIGQRRGNCARLFLFYAMADLVDALDILPARLERDIRVSSAIFLMGVQLSREARAALTTEEDSRLTDLEITQRLMQHPRVIQVKDWLLTQQDLSIQASDRFLDRAFIDQTEWRLERILAPKHAIHL